MSDDQDGPGIQIVRRGAAAEGGRRPSDPSVPRFTDEPERPAAPAAAPRAAASPTPALDLDRVPSNPAVQAWNQEFSSGSYRAADLVAQAEYSEDERGAAFAAGIPSTNTSARVASRSPVKLVVIGLIVAGGLALGGKVAYSKLAKAGHAPSASASHTAEDEFVEQMQGGGNALPECFTSDDGYSFVYKTGQGEMKKVRTIAEVPAGARVHAVCVPD